MLFLFRGLISGPKNVSQSEDELVLWGRIVVVVILRLVILLALKEVK